MRRSVLMRRATRSSAALLLLGQLGLVAAELHAESASAGHVHDVVQSEGAADHRHHQDECQICRTLTATAAVAGGDRSVPAVPASIVPQRSADDAQSARSSFLPPPARGPPTVT